MPGRGYVWRGGVRNVKALRLLLLRSLDSTGSLWQHEGFGIWPTARVPAKQGIQLTILHAGASLPRRSKLRPGNGVAVVLVGLPGGHGCTNNN